MYSPQRNNKAPFDRYNPHNKSPNEYRTQKRPNEGLTLEEFLAKKSSRSPIRSATTTRSLPNRTNTTVQNRLAITRSSPIRPSTVRKRTSTMTSTAYKRTRTTVPQKLECPVINSTRTTLTTSVRPTVIPNRRPTVYNKPTHVDKFASHHTAHPQKPKVVSEQKIQVCIRKRPLNRTEILNHEHDIAPLSGSRTIEILAPK